MLQSAVVAFSVESVQFVNPGFEPSSSKLTTPLGGMAVPTALSLTYAVHESLALTATDVVVHVSIADEFRRLMTMLAVFLLVECALSPV
jgi:hypothetical protein